MIQKRKKRMKLKLFSAPLRLGGKKIFLLLKFRLQIRLNFPPRREGAKICAVEFFAALDL